PTLAQIHILVLEAAHFGDPGPRRKEGLQNSNIPDEGSVCVGAGVGMLVLEAVEVLKEALEVGQGDGAREAASLLDSHVHLAKGVDGDEILPLEEVEEGLQGRH